MKKFLDVVLAVALWVLMNYCIFFNSIGIFVFVIWDLGGTIGKLVDIAIAIADIAIIIAVIKDIIR